MVRPHGSVPCGKIKTEADKLGIETDDREFHCRASINFLTKSRSNNEALKAVYRICRKDCSIKNGKLPTHKSLKFTKKKSFF